jgi:hypothetical protein
MIKEDLLYYFKYGNRFCGVEVLQVNGENKYYGILLKKKRKELDIETSFEADDIDTLKTFITKDKPITLVINTDFVLTKKVQGKTSESLELAHLAFPNIKIEDFYFETLSQNENHFISICRKSYVDDLLKAFNSSGLAVIDFTLGSLISSSIANFISTSDIKTSNSLIALEDSRIRDISSERISQEITYSINGLDVNNHFVLGFAAALNLVLKDPKIKSSFTATKANLNTVFQQKQFAKHFLKIGLSALFVALLINFLLFNHYYSGVQTLRETAQILESSKVKMVSLNEKVEKTEKMVEDVLQGSASKSSFYVDVIINNLPRSILLKELNYQPLIKKIKEDKAIENHKNTILISGESSNSLEFSQWISQLENFKWIESVDILSFEDLSNSSSNFTLKLNIKHETEN